jgi:asparagine synthase (glutamine-hydrolysing)
MCGITGCIDLETDVSEDIIKRMNNSLKHRGPDDEGIYISENKKIALAHRRLSFLDLSEKGKQPMHNNSKNVTITFNGEIYNYLNLKKELKEYSFNSNSDTEVILAGYEKWGINVVEKLNGMFAFALLDEKIGKLFLVRDRFGIKPLYYSIQDSKLFFASELKAIHGSGMGISQIDYSSFIDYFVYRYIPSPKTIWNNIFKLSPAHYAEIDLDNLNINLFEYWKLNSNNTHIKNDEIIHKIDSLLIESVEKHSQADVPIGSFLSGGYDSSALVYYMNKLGILPKTFSIGFNNWDRSEDYYAKIVANHFNLEIDVVLADENSLKLLDILPNVFDEPIADISVVPTYMVSHLARQKVKAVLSGEGADEIFGGYTWQHEFYSKNNPISSFDKIRNILKPINTVEFYANSMAMGLFDKDELKKMLHPSLHASIPEDVFWFYRKHFRDQLSPLKSIQYMDIKCFMGELVLTKIDRASMANSLEVRVPFLDHELFEYVFSLDEGTYYKKEQTKYLLYENIKKHLPTEILNRKKQGFVGPDSYYMDREWYAKQLNKSKLVEYNLINQSYIDNLLKESYNWKLWKILIMEKWFQQWMCN